MVVHAWYSTAWERKRQEFEDAWSTNRVQGQSELNSKILIQKQKKERENSFKLRISTENYTNPSPTVFSLMYKSVLNTTGFTL